MVCAGGAPIDTTGIEIYSFQLDIWTLHQTSQTGLPPSKFVNQITFNQTLYFIGRYDYTVDGNTDEIFTFDPDTLTVNQIGSLNQAVYQSALILFNIQ